MTSHEIPPEDFQTRLLSEAEAHRKFLESSLKIAAVTFGVVMTFGLGLAVWFVESSASAAAGSAALRVLDEERGRKRFRDAVDTALQEAVTTLPEKATDAVERAFHENSAAKTTELVKGMLKDLGASSAEAIVLAEAQKQAVATPVGAILAWPSDPKLLDSEKWKVCDGGPLAFSGHEVLWQKVLRNRFLNGKTPNAGQMLLPDFRGYFLRGFDSRPNGRDPDRASHGKRVGSDQLDALQRFQVSQQTTKSGFHAGNHGIAWMDRCDGTANTQRIQKNVEHARFSSETRPANIAVHWIIRVK